MSEVTPVVKNWPKGYIVTEQDRLLENIKGLMGMIQSRLTGIPERFIKKVGFNWVGRSLEDADREIKRGNLQEAHDILSGVVVYTLALSDTFCAFQDRVNPETW